jgi:hypothetical protein
LAAFVAIRPKKTIRPKKQFVQKTIRQKNNSSKKQFVQKTIRPKKRFVQNRWADGAYDRLPTLAAHLVRQRRSY